MHILKTLRIVGLGVLAGVAAYAPDALAQATVSMSAYVSSQIPDNNSRAILPVNIRNAILSIPNNMYAEIPFTGMISTTQSVTATYFFGNGSHLTGIVAAASDKITSGTTNVTAVSSTGTISLTTAGSTNSYLNSGGLVTPGVSATAVTATTIGATTGNFTGIGVTSINASGVISATGATGTVTATYGYFRYISGSAAGLTNVPAPSSVSYSLLVGVPAGVQNISTTTGSVTVTTVYTGGLTATSATTLGTVSTTGYVSNSAMFSNYINEGLVTVNASTSTTALTLGVASVLSGTITTNTTVALSGIPTATSGYTVWWVCQDGTGGRTINYPTTARFNGNASPTLVTTAGTCSLLVFQSLAATGHILVSMPATGVSP